jgi:hypothetical protein
MKVQCTNDHTKMFLAQHGPAKVFGKDVDSREHLEAADAIRWFQRIWESKIEPALQEATSIDASSVLNKVPEQSRTYVNLAADHKEFWVAGCLLIAQLVEPQSCDQLWYISSTSGDPRTLYVKFPTVAEREKFSEMAKKLGWEDDALGLKLARDFMDTFGGFRSHDKRK